jgi:hypothetical protein
MPTVKIHGQVADEDHQIGLHERFEPHFAPHIERQIQGRLPMLAFLNQVRKPTLDLPLDVRRKMWFKPFMQS